MALSIALRTDAGSVLVFAGLLNVVTGLVFRLPLPVQPMKAIAAVAIAEALAPGEIAAAGFVAGAIVLVLGLTGAVGLVERWVPRPVVRGIQLGVGMKLAAKGLEMIAELPWGGADSLALALGGAALVLATAHVRRFPSALVLLAGGLDYAFLSVKDESSSVSLVSALVGGGAYFWFTPRFAVKASALAGGYLGFLSGGGSASAQLAVEAGAQLE